MKISELVHYRELLASLRPQDSLATLQREMDPVLYSIDTHRIQMPEYLARLQILRESASSAITQFNQEIDLLQQDLLDQISALEPSYFARSYQLSLIHI